MTLHVQYQDGKYDYVDGRTLDRLIDDNRVRLFYRPSERKWIDVDTDPLRGKIRFYRLAEKRWVNLDVNEAAGRPQYEGFERRAISAAA